MKKLNSLIIALIILNAILSSACAESEQSKLNSNAAAPTVEKQTYKSSGDVKEIDLEKGEITIAHEEIPGYMSAMEMTEPVADKKMLESVKIGDKVEFEIERAGSEITVTKIVRTGETALLKGGEIFKTNCAECHGEKGQGTEKGISFLKGHALDHTESEFIEQVRNGEKGEMPAFKDKLSEEEIAAVVKFVRTELQKNATGGKSHSH